MHPTLFTLPSPLGLIVVHAFGTLLALSVLLGWYVQRRDARFRSEALGRVYLFTVLVALVGARAMHLVTTYPAIRGPFDLFALGDGGLVGMGGLFAALALLPVAARMERDQRIDVTAPVLADAFVMPALLAGVLTSIGAYLAGSDFGRVLQASSPSLLRKLGTYPAYHAAPGTLGRHLDGPPVLLHQIDVFPERITPAAAWSLPTHPVQLYEAALLVIVTLLVARVAKREPAHGTIALVASLGYALAKLATDPFRGDPERVRLGATSLPFVLATLTAIAVSSLLARRVYAARKIETSAPAA